ncbi:AT hook domain-containing protein family protein [Mycena sanguinolenta]|uniref:AT hook domain-containing protein family protein n=1 Tax=Mycena sanguinolenta TaxID=230812 RepID=A0A8H6YZG9_9AGAR|nr:AT hook domain-containing protein family protein [Mycena sanguinolenta]
MSDSTRRLRSSSRVTVQAPPPSNSPTSAASGVIQIIKPGSRLPGLEASELALLREKQRKLRTQAQKTVASLPTDSQHMRTALEASLIFAQEEAGSAVCVDPAGWVLTCAHCIAETEDEYRTATAATWWLLFYTGLAVQVECRAWDPQRDLALLKIIATECNRELPAFRSLHPSASAPASGTRIVCIGQPGQDDLESASARRTNYPFVFVSSGKVRGMLPGADPHDNSEIGTLKHDAWTYWGHSGAPLIHMEDGTLIGLHSSWDDETAMRHGVPHVAIQTFLRQHLNV